jgi:dolichol kinase
VCNDKCEWENNMLCVSVIFGSNDNIIVCVCVWLLIYIMAKTQ